MGEPSTSPTPLNSAPPPPLPLPAPPAPPVPTSEQWVVEFARYYNFPKRSSASASASSSSSASEKARLRPLSRGKKRTRGTWLPAASPAILRLGHRAASDAAPAPAPAPGPVLSITLGQEVYEEHLVSNLYYSWPQVACVPECPVRGSRAVFFSYKDSSKLVEKFAVRFPTSADAEKFLCSVKGYIPGFTCHGDNNGRKQLCLVDGGTLDANKQLMVVDSADLKSQIMKCIAESSFQEMLSKLDKTINALGGDLAL